MNLLKWREDLTPQEQSRPWFDPVLGGQRSLHLQLKNLSGWGHFGRWQWFILKLVWCYAMKQIWALVRTGSGSCRWSRLRRMLSVSVSDQPGAFPTILEKKIWWWLWYVLLSGSWHQKIPCRLSGVIVLAQIRHWHVPSQWSSRTVIWRWPNLSRSGDSQSNCPLLIKEAFNRKQQKYYST